MSLRRDSAPIRMQWLMFLALSLSCSNAIGADSGAAQSSFSSARTAHGPTPSEMTMPAAGAVDTGPVRRAKLQWLLQQNRAPEVMRLCSMDIRVNPNDADAYYFRAYGGKFARNTQDAAVLDINRAISLKPDVAEYYTLKALILHMLQEDEQALPVIDKAYKMAPSVWAVADLKAQILTSLRQPLETRRHSRST